MTATESKKELQIRWFPAKWPGACAACGESFVVDSEVGFPRTSNDVIAFNERIVARECCGGSGKIIESDSDGEFVADLNKVMPHGKTKKDACRDCYLIHSPGQTECE